ncbi:MAG: hypothetical protein U0350_50580 [Caldilineaceae bacterium]
MYPWPELIHLWEHEQLTAEQLIGQLVRYGEAHEALLTALRRQQENQAQLINTLTARVVALETGRAKPTSI